MSRSRYFCLLALLVAVAGFGLVYPVYVIRPFRHQGPGELQAALLVLQYRGVAEALLAIAVLFTLAVGWRSIRGIGTKVAGILATLLVLACGFLSRVNIYEIMFHPVDRPAFGAASESRLDGAERVVAVKIGGAARAYPIRNMAYHHVVNDVVGGVPLAATY
jgi:hypothetical protein